MLLNYSKQNKLYGFPFCIHLTQLTRSYSKEHNEQRTAIKTSFSYQVANNSILTC